MIFLKKISKDINNLNLLFDYINHIRPNNLKKYDNSETDILITHSIRLLIQPKAGQSVYDPCFGSGNLLNSIKYFNVNEEDNIKIYGKESSIDAWLKCIAESCLKDRFENGFEFGSSLDSLDKKKYDIVVMDAPYSTHDKLKNSKFINVRNKKTTELFIEHSINKLNSMGKVYL